MAEYSIIATNIDLKPEIYSATGEQVAKALTLILGRILNKTNKACNTIAEYRSPTFSTPFVCEIYYPPDT